MLRIFPVTTCLCTLAMLSISAFADTVTLKNGQRLEGKITKETASDITMDVKVAAGITDERIISRAEIDKTDKTPPDVEAYKAVAAIKLGKDSLPLAQYDLVIGRLRTYVTQFPTGVHVADVQTILDSFVAEKARVEGGEMRLDDKWLNKAEVEKEKVQINARLAFGYMRGQSAAGDYVGAMNTYTAIEKAFPGASIMPEAIDLATQVMAALKTVLDKAIPNQKALMKDNEKSIASTTPAEGAQIKAALKQEQDAMAETVKAADAAGKWAPLLPKSEASLTSLYNKVKSEGSRIAGLPVAKMQKSLQITVAAREAISGGDLTGATDKLKEATALWPANELAQRLAKETAEAQKTAAKETATAAVTPAPGAAKATPVAASTPKHITTPAPSTQAAPAASADDDRSFFTTLPGAIVLLVVLAVVLAGANVFLKMKKRKAEEEAENS